jgi:hypothetical protein
VKISIKYLSPFFKLARPLPKTAIFTLPCRCEARRAKTGLLKWLCALLLRLVIHFAIELILINDEALMPAASNEVDAIVCLHLKY